MKLKAFAAALAALSLFALAVPPAKADGPQPMDLARATWARGARMSRRIAALLDESRRVGDARRAGCLDDALSRVDSQLRLIQERSNRLARASELHDAAATQRELRLLGYVARQLPETEILADACIGVIRHAGVREETVVETTVPTDLPSDWDVRL